MYIKSDPKVWKVKSSTDKNIIYDVIYNQNKWTCTCKSYTYGNNKYTITENGEIVKPSCKHIEHIKTIYEPKKLKTKHLPKIKLINI